MLGLWLLIVGSGCHAQLPCFLCDTTAVLVTPVVLALARQLDLDVALFAYTAVWLANTASLFLPVSNLTNLLALSALPCVVVGCCDSACARCSPGGCCRGSWSSGSGYSFILVQIRS